MTIQTLDDDAMGYRPHMAAGAPAMTMVWTAYDLGVAILAILLSTDSMNRFGVASPGWALVYALAALRIALSWKAFGAIIARNLAFFVYPAVCISSAIWSVDPMDSLVAALQLLMTVLIALYVGTRFRLPAICFMHFSIITFTAVLSLLNWATGIFGNVYAGSGGLLGIYTQKNALGQRCAIAIVAAVSLLLMPISRWSGIFKIGVLGTTAVLTLALILSKSVTPMLLLPVFLGVLILLCLHRLSPGMILFGIVGIIVVGGLGPFAMSLADVDPVTFTLKAFGKDATLTGRTSLWGIAEHVLTGNWFFGVGFLAFWKSPVFANLVLLAQSIGGETALGFHNFILEIWVGTGIPGVLAMLTLVLTGLSRSARLWWITRDVSAAYATSAIAMSIALALLGGSLYRQHEFSIMLITMMGVAAGEALLRIRIGQRN